MKDEFTRRNNITGLSDAGELPLTSVENLTPTDIESYGNNAIAIVGMACRLPGILKRRSNAGVRLLITIVLSILYQVNGRNYVRRCPPVFSAKPVVSMILIVLMRLFSNFRQEKRNG